MRRYIQTLSRALYQRVKTPSKPVATSVEETTVVPTQLPLQETKPICESISDEVKWHSIRVALKTLERDLKMRIKEDKARSVVDLNFVLSPLQKKEFSDIADSKEPLEKKEETVEKPTVQEPTFNQLFSTTRRNPFKPNNRVTVVGASDVGMATVFSLLAKGVTNDISIVDFSENKLKGELLDLQCGSNFLQNSRLRASKDYAISADSKIVVLTPCCETASGDKASDCESWNTEVIKAVVPQLLRYSPDCVILVALDPVDVLTYLTWKVSDLPKGRVVGSGTNLSSATFRYLLSDRLGLAPSACKGFIIGENGESSVPVWSSVMAGGVLLKDLNPNIGTDSDPEKWQDIHRQVVQSTQEVKDLKGCNSWAAALSITDICTAILNDSNCVRPISTFVKGEHNIEDEVFLSLPCVVGANGVTDIIRQPLSQTELDLLHRSAATIAENLGTIKIVQ